MKGIIVRHNAIVIYTFYAILALNFVPAHTLNQILHVPSLMHRAESIPAIPPAPYTYNTSEMDSVIPPLPVEEQAAIYKRGR